MLTADQAREAAEKFHKERIEEQIKVIDESIAELANIGQSRLSLSDWFCHFATNEDYVEEIVKRYRESGFQILGDDIEDMYISW